MYKKWQSRALVSFREKDLKRVIALRKEWAETYLLSSVKMNKAHQSWIKLLETLLRMEPTKRKDAFPRLLQTWQKCMMKE